MTPSMALVFGGAPANASIPTYGLEPVFWLVLALLAACVARLGYASWSAARPGPPSGPPRLRALRPPRLAHAARPSYSEAL